MMIIRIFRYQVSAFSPMKLLLVFVCGMILFSAPCLAQKTTEEEFEWNALDVEKRTEDRGQKTEDGRKAEGGDLKPEKKGGGVKEASLLPEEEVAADEEFEWDLLKEDGNKGGGIKAEGGDARGQRAEDRGQKTEDKGQVDAPEARISNPVTPAQDDGAMYGELLRENLKMRAQISELSEGARKETEGIAKEKESLLKAIKELEKSNDVMASRIKEIEGEQDRSPENLDKLVDLEKKLTEAKQEKERLARELEEARHQAETAVSRNSKEGMSIQPGSDLFKTLQQENQAMKDKLVEIETARQKAIQEKNDAARLSEKTAEEIKAAQEKQKRLEEELKVARLAEKERKKVVDKMVKEIPDLEKKLSTLNNKIEEKDAALTASESAIDILKEELERRDRRFVKAERMAELLEKAREDLKQVSNIEKRDMHFNMAVVYAKEGKFNDAEREYLRALEMDPTDAGVHYNLGILYDDELVDKRKAAIHYKKYIQLAPYAQDIDEVKNWLLAIEMKR